MAILLPGDSSNTHVIHWWQFITSVHITRTFLGYGKTLSSIVFTGAFASRCSVLRLCVSCVCACVCRRVCVCVCVWIWLCVCNDCVSVLQGPITLHFPTCRHIKYVPLTMRVCECVCASCVCTHACYMYNSLAPTLPNTCTLLFMPKYIDLDDFQRVSVLFFFPPYYSQRYH